MSLPYAGRIVKYRAVMSDTGALPALEITVSDGDHDIMIVTDSMTLAHMAAYAENPENFGTKGVDTTRAGR